MTVQSEIILEALAKVGAEYSGIRLEMKGGDEMNIHRESEGWVAELHNEVMRGNFILVTNTPEMEIILSEYGSPFYKRIAMFTAAIQCIEARMTDGSETRTLWEVPR